MAISKKYIFFVFLNGIFFVFISSALSCKKPPEKEILTNTTLDIKYTEPTVYEPKLPTKLIEVDGHRILVEIADGPAERQRGLMFRYHLPDTVGMLFIFDEVQPHPFWMKNTYIPLDIAFIDENFIITDIKWMEPHDERSVYPSRAIKYALETNRGWFLKRNIKPGAKIKM